MVNLEVEEVEQVEMKRTDGDFADALVSHPVTLLACFSAPSDRFYLPSTPPHYVSRRRPFKWNSAAPAARSSPIVL